MGFIRVGVSLQREVVFMCDVCENIDRFCGSFICMYTHMGMCVYNVKLIFIVCVCVLSSKPFGLFDSH